MAKGFSFDSENGIFHTPGYSRKALTIDGCNEPYKNRYYCPKAEWVKKERCPFINKRECDNYKLMCGKL